MMPFWHLVGMSIWIPVGVIQKSESHIFRAQDGGSPSQLYLLVSVDTSDHLIPAPSCSKPPSYLPDRKRRHAAVEVSLQAAWRP